MKPRVLRENGVPTLILPSVFCSSWQISIPANGNYSILMEDDNLTPNKRGDRKTKEKLADSASLLQYN